MKARLATEVAKRYKVRLWGDPKKPCPKGKGSLGCCTPAVEITKEAFDERIELEAGVCEDCGRHVIAAEEPSSQSWAEVPVYDTPSGKLEPGCLYWVDVYQRSDGSGCWLHGKEHCDGRHLSAMLPTGETWDIDGRANNCPLPQDNAHRCWVRHGTPPNVHVDKNGHTCAAGGGSIMTARYHGFLHHGEFTP